MFCCLQWLWAVMLYISILQTVVKWLLPVHDQRVRQAPNFNFEMPGPLEVIVVAIVTAIMVAVTIYAIVKMPMSVVKTGNKITHTAAKTAAPVVIKAQHKKDTKKARAMLTPRLALAAKTLLMAAPLALTAGSGLLEEQPIDHSIALIVGGGLAVLAGVFFACQYALALGLRVKMADLW